MTGTLVLVATPIGNLGDLSPRAVATLQQSSLILCDDTRHSGKLLSHAGIRGVRLAVCNEHTESERAHDVLSLLEHQLKMSKVQVRRDLTDAAVVVRGTEYKLHLWTITKEIKDRAREGEKGKE